MTDIKAIDVTDPDELASELDQLSHKYAMKTGDYSTAGSLSAAADWLRFQAERIAELEAKIRESQWVAVSERLPEQEGRYLTFDGETVESATFFPANEYDEAMWSNALHYFDGDDVTHWMPTPPLPEGGDR